MDTEICFVLLDAGIDGPIKHGNHISNHNSICFWNESQCEYTDDSARLRDLETGGDREVHSDNEFQTASTRHISHMFHILGGLCLPHLPAASTPCAKSPIEHEGLRHIPRRSARRFC
jgi:hypothetical protein